MIYLKRLLLATIIISCLVSLQGCLGRSDKQPRLFFIKKGEPAPISGIAITREDFTLMLERLEEAEK